MYIWHPASKEYVSNVTVRILSLNGEKIVYIDQQKSGGMWKKLGIYDFDQGRHKSLIIEADKSEKIIVADAVKFEFIK